MTAAARSATAKTAADFNREYLAVHVAKEDLFWTTYMGVTPQAGPFHAAEAAFKIYISDPTRMNEVRAALAALPAASLSSETEADRGNRRALDGWRMFFEANTVEGAEAQALQQELIRLEGQLFEKRAKVSLSFKDSLGNSKPGSTNVMAANIAASADETVRKSSHQALLDLEQWVLTNGFLEIVRKRNEFARALGFADYFALRVMKNERLTVPALFEILEGFEAGTREANQRMIRDLVQTQGAESVLGHNIKYASSGGAEKDLDPYFPFERSLQNWAQSFARLGIRYRGASLSLDLIERKGKYENGFMHGPQPCYFDEGTWIPARINFTSNATPDQVGSGRIATNTLFHEGGHAAHFSNITQNAPCYSQEFPPTSMAYAETQSMFCDSLISDGDWLKLYACDLHGNAIPDAVIRKALTTGHPVQAFRERGILVVPVFERALYSLSDVELTVERVTRLARETEKHIQHVECGPRPLLAIPHLLSGEGACSYQGYLLANMAVYQTRDHFKAKYGYLTDQPAIGPDLETHYWNLGNIRSHSEAIRSLTGQGLSGEALARFCNLSTDEYWEETQKSIINATDRKVTGAAANVSSASSPTLSADEAEPQLDANIRIVHGAEEIANNQVSMQRLFADFEAWVGRHYPRVPGEASRGSAAGG